MALLRECLQELRVKHREWDVPAGAWPEPKPGCGPNRRHGMGPVPLRRTAPDSQRLPTA